MSRASGARAAVLVSLLLSLLLWGCLGRVEPEVGEPVALECDPQDSDPTRDVSFTADILPLLERPPNAGGCVACHDAAGRNPIGYERAGLDLSDYRQLVRGGNTSGSDIVVPGDPCASILLQKIGEAPPFGARMPLSGPPHFSPTEEQLVHDWIAEGARAD